MDSSKVTKVILGIIVVAILLAVGFFAYNRANTPTKEKEAVTKPKNQNTPPKSAITKGDLANATSLLDSSGKAVGDVTRSLKGQTTTMAVRVEGLPDLSSGAYGAFLMDRVGSNEPPAFIGPLVKLTSGEFAGDYALGSQGPDYWMDFAKIAISRINSVETAQLGNAIVTGSLTK